MRAICDHGQVVGSACEVCGGRWMRGACVADVYVRCTVMMVAGGVCALPKELKRVCGLSAIMARLPAVRVRRMVDGGLCGGCVCALHGDDGGRWCMRVAQEAQTCMRAICEHDQVA